MTLSRTAGGIVAENMYVVRYRRFSSSCSSSLAGFRLCEGMASITLFTCVHAREEQKTGMRERETQMIEREDRDDRKRRAEHRDERKTEKND
eukprot:1150034-Pelagomonas_calceolata.AAC.4